MHYGNVLTGFKTDYEAYSLLKKQDEPDAPVVNDKDKEKKIIKWMPLFEDALSRTFGSKGPLIYVLRENANVPSEVDDPLNPNSHYGQSGSMIEDLLCYMNIACKIGTSTDDFTMKIAKLFANLPSFFALDRLYTGVRIKCTYFMKT
jgi:hypothetical protein